MVMGRKKGVRRRACKSSEKRCSISLKIPGFHKWAVRRTNKVLLALRTDVPRDNAKISSAFVGILDPAVLRKIRELGLARHRISDIPVNGIHSVSCIETLARQLRATSRKRFCRVTPLILLGLLSDHKNRKCCFVLSHSSRLCPTQIAFPKVDVRTLEKVS
jgi:hypothetical protein